MKVFMVTAIGDYGEGFALVAANNSHEAINLLRSYVSIKDHWNCRYDRIRDKDITEVSILLKYSGHRPAILGSWETGE